MAEASRVLVTGGAGFIGSHVAEMYLAEGFQVTVLDDLSSGRRENVPAAATFVHADVASPETRRLVGRGGFTLVNHHAAQMDVRVSVRDPAFDARTNILGLLNLLEGGREGGVRRFVFASSGGVVYGESDRLPHPESAPKLPVSPYGVSKLASEYYLSAYAKLYGLDVISLRYANVYGPRQNPHGEAGVVAIFGSRLHRREPLTIHGDGSQTRDYVYVGDVVTANHAATHWRVPGVGTLNDVAFNVGTGIETSVNQLAQAMLDATGVSVPIQHAPARAGELRRSAVSVERAAREWDWRPGCSLREGLKLTYEWIVEDAA
ncbi:MAG: NAD-dependent epimerase/dehydratase family protein [Gemmatimonadales bacterium]|nr:NAD-dependent epimerase/dehydratase family protein [Gemmatimonadales bacterium]NIN09859.1 NAD-dependent epimerase/dehydratase family protein [Gemmatimonadales bacterium]NIN48563.1 NAD-dependent epimerase/dehydratase family protein [Gemmatimonadales bacterium]NIP06027.1 NAD-dependent epimerase/dehydratase family protein [Gemmatimonadales bacterium]NIR01173.1 NAD-dependent epimerase/dehydratase family protein [Gemmatimonadales bacterium]